MVALQLKFARTIWKQRHLIAQLSKRKIEERYRGSILGWTWSFTTPLLMLAVYTFVFSEVFQARWGDLDDSGPIGFAMNLFAGLIIFNVFSEVANQSPDLIPNNSNLVTKVVFHCRSFLQSPFVQLFFMPAQALQSWCCSSWSAVTASQEAFLRYRSSGCQALPDSSRSAGSYQHWEFS